jgi:hypothetical protein
VTTLHTLESTMAESQDNNEQINIIEKAIKNPDISQIYFNGFANSVGAGDVIIVLQRNGEEVAVLNTSFTMAKTLVEKLGKLISVLESSTGNNIMTTEEVSKALEKHKEEKD